MFGLGKQNGPETANGHQGSGKVHLIDLHQVVKTFELGWSPRLPLWLEIVALVFVVLGSLGGVWAMTVNRFFSAVVRVQRGRGHTVVTGGPYRFVRHPAYAGSMLAWLATPLMLGSLWAYIPVGLLIAVLVVRTAFEDKTLRSELAGYEDYAQRTRYRLVPGVW